MSPERYPDRYMDTASSDYSDYSEHDSERVRQAERAASSAGLPTLPLAPATSEPAKRQPGDGVGLMLIAAGVLGLLAQAAPSPGELTGGLVLLTIASCFLFFAFWKHVYGLLIPGCILGGLSLGVTFASLTSGVSVLWGLSLGFLAILLLGTSLFGVRSPWPVYPAVALFAVGLIVLIATLPAIFMGALFWLPLLLIVAGLALGWRHTCAAAGPR